MKTIPTVEKTEWTLVNPTRAKADTAYDAAVEFLRRPPYGTEMRSSDNETGMALGSGATFCHDHRRVEAGDYWMPDTTK